MTQAAVSADGTEIAFETTGSGPALVIVDGAMCYRGMGPSRDLSEQLASTFTTVAYDRRGRGESGPGVEGHGVDREVQDLAAVIAAVGGHAHVLGVSSGALLALRAAQSGVAIDRLATYEAPMVLDDSHPATDPGLPAHLEELVASGERGKVVNEFFRLVGMPAPFRWLTRLLPVWKKILPVAHTIPWDLSLVLPLNTGQPLPDGEFSGVSRPALVLVGGKSPTYMRNAQAALADALPGAELVELAGQTHMVRAKVVAPVLKEFLLR